MRPLDIPAYLNTEEERAAYVAGYDCGANGADALNCHFTHFSAPRQTRAWELGKNRADRSKTGATTVAEGAR